MLTGHKARLPQVSAATTLKDIAITRGLSDSFALRLANHKDDIHNRYMPQGKNARAMFEAVEQARIEAIGANAMPGVAMNLSAMLDDKYSKTVVNRSSNRRDTPLGRSRGPHPARTSHGRSTASRGEDLCRSLAQLGG